MERRRRLGSLAWVGPAVVARAGAAGGSIKQISKGARAPKQ